MADTAKFPSQQPSARHTEEGDRFNRTLFAAIDAIEAADIPYALIGGIAASGLGRPRSTHDIDIFVRPEDAEAAVESFRVHEFKTEKTNPMWLFKGWKEEILVDIIFKSSGDIYFDDEMAGRARVINYHGRDLKAVAPEDLVIIKSAVHNEVGPHHWHDALAILSHANMDWDYLLKRARKAPRRLLALLIYAQSNDILIPNRIIFDLFHIVFEDIKQSAIAPSSTASFSSPTQVFHHTSHHPKVPEYLVGRIKDALAHDERTGDQDIKIIVGESHIVVRGESASELQKRAIQEVIQVTAPGFYVENQIRVPILPGPEGSEYIL